MPFFPIYNDEMFDNEYGALDIQSYNAQAELARLNALQAAANAVANSAIPQTNQGAGSSGGFSPVVATAMAATSKVQVSQNNLSTLANQGAGASGGFSPVVAAAMSNTTNTTTKSQSNISNNPPANISNNPPAAFITVAAQPQNISPVPLTATVVPATTPTTKAVKTAPIDTILFDDEAVPVDTMADLIFENIGGQELINISRNDIINGENIKYQPIKNLSIIQQKYNPNNIISLQDTSDKYFANFTIKLENKIPNEGNGPNGSNVYIDENTGDLVIETINIQDDEQIETQINLSGTIYEAEL